MLSEILEKHFAYLISLVANIGKYLQISIPLISPLIFNDDASEIFVLILTAGIIFLCLEGRRSDAGKAYKCSEYAHYWGFASRHYRYISDIVQVRLNPA